MLVFVQVSSINTSRAGSNIPCACIQRRRARTTSARCCSAACKVFFKADVAPIEEPPNRGAAARDSSFLRRRNDLVQRQVWLLGNQNQQEFCVIFSSGEVLPPLGLAAKLPVCFQRCAQITTT